MAHFVITNKQWERQDGTSQIIIRYTWKGKNYPKKIPGLYCKKDDLDPIAQQVTKGFDKETLRGINNKITEIKLRASSVLLEYEDPAPEFFFTKLFAEPKEEKQKKATDLIDLYKQWTDSEATSKVYSTTLPHLIDFKESRGNLLQAEEYSKILLKEFEAHLMKNGYIQNNRRIENGEVTKGRSSDERIMFKHSALKKHMKHFKFFGKYLTDLELPIKQSFRDYTFSIPSPEIPDTIALTKAEFDEFFYFDLKDNFDLRLTQAAFIIGTAAGGIRISDLYNLTKESFDMQNFSVSFTQIKTGGDVHNPLNEEYIKPHLEFYLENLHKMPTEQEFNRRLKEIGNLIGWERTEVVNEYRGNNRRPSKIQVAIKDNISSKYMRKTFISMLVELGYTKEVIKSFSGHKDDKVIDHYIQLHQHTKRQAISKLTPKGH